VINSANLSNTSALNFYSPSFPTWASLTSFGHARTVQAETRVYNLNQPGRKRNSETSLRCGSS
jgi:hypothetical protein